MLISDKYVSSSSMYKPNSVGEEGHPCLIPMSDITLPCVFPFIQPLHRVWCTWLLQLVVNEAVHLIVGGVPIACH